MWGKTTVTMSRHWESGQSPAGGQERVRYFTCTAQIARTSKKPSACLSFRMRFAKPSKPPLAMPFRGFGTPVAPCRFPRAPRGPLSYFAKHSEQPLGLFPVGDRRTRVDPPGRPGSDSSSKGRENPRWRVDQVLLLGKPEVFSGMPVAAPDVFCLFELGKRYVICLGTAFWRSVAEPRRSHDDNLTLVHEALHIYFGSLIAHGEKGRYGNANCYERFVMSDHWLVLALSHGRGLCTTCEPVLVL